MGGLVGEKDCLTPRENSPNFLAKLSSEVISVSLTVQSYLHCCCYLHVKPNHFQRSFGPYSNWGDNRGVGKLSVLPDGSQPRWYHHPVRSQGSLKSAVWQPTETNLRKKKKAPPFQKRKFNTLGRAFIILQRSSMLIIQISTFTYYLSWTGRGKNPWKCRLSEGLKDDFSACHLLSYPLPDAFLPLFFSLPLRFFSMAEDLIPLQDTGIWAEVKLSLLQG